MSEIEEIRMLINEGFRPAMLLRKPTEDEIRRLPESFAKSEVRALPLDHPDGRSFMYYMTDSAAIEFATALVAEKRRVIGYVQFVYCSGIGPDAVLGNKLYLNGLVDELRTILNWETAVSEYPHTFEVSFSIEGDDRITLDSNTDSVCKIALGLSLRNKVGFVVGHNSPGPRYQGQPFAFKTGLSERYVHGLTRSQLDYLEEILKEPDAIEAAEALRTIYCQVSNASRITVGWAAIEQIFSSPPVHVLNQKDLKSVIEAVDGLLHIPDEKRHLLKMRLNDPSLFTSENRNQRISRNIADRIGDEYEKVYLHVRSLTKERGRRVHALSRESRPSKGQVDFVERVLWAIIETSVSAPNPFSNSD